MFLRYVTLTGADDSVQPEDLLRLSAKYPYVEWGVLFSQNKSGEPRYPSVAWVGRLVAAVKAAGGRPHLAAHLCGKWVQDAIDGHVTFLDNPSMAETFDRYQLNMGTDRLRQAAASPGLLAEALSVSPWHFMVGGNYFNVAVSAEFLMRVRAFPLFDASGGRGVRSETWPLPIRIDDYLPEDCRRAPLMSGYAGGLGPDNVAAELERINAVAEDAVVWVDMESSLRSEDGKSFSLEKCEAVLRAARPWVRRWDVTD